MLTWQAEDLDEHAVSRHWKEQAIGWQRVASHQQDANPVCCQWAQRENAPLAGPLRSGPGFGGSGDDRQLGLQTSGETGNNGSGMTNDGTETDSRCEVESGITGTGGSSDSNAGGDSDHRQSWCCHTSSSSETNDLSADHDVEPLTVLSTVPRHGTIFGVSSGQCI